MKKSFLQLFYSCSNLSETNVTRSIRQMNSVYHTRLITPSPHYAQENPVIISKRFVLRGLFANLLIYFADSLPYTSQFFNLVKTNAIYVIYKASK